MMNILDLCDDILNLLNDNVLISMKEKEYKKNYDSVIWDIYSISRSYRPRGPHEPRLCYCFEGCEPHPRPCHSVANFIRSWQHDCRKNPPSSLNYYLTNLFHSKKRELHNELYIKNFKPSKESIRAFQEEISEEEKDFGFTSDDYPSEESSDSDDSDSDSDDWHY